MRKKIDVQKIDVLVAQQLSAQMIAVKLGYCRLTVSRHASDKSLLRKNGKKWQGGERNKGKLKYGVRFVNILNVYVQEGHSSKVIAQKLQISTPTVWKYATDKEKLRQNSRIARGNSRRINGQAALYRQIRQEIRDGKHPCQKCGTIKQVQIHHIEKQKYNKSWRVLAIHAKNDQEDIQFLCSSCHQKEHYRNYARPKVAHCITCGCILRKDGGCTKCLKN